MTTYFSNESALDLNSLKVMGLSFKNTSSPIGQFGTGLKYAIATLLRDNNKIRITTNGTSYDFSVKTQKFREDHTFEQITMVNSTNREIIQLPFTIELGKFWKVENAYRELASNVMDESGIITKNKSDIPSNYKTTIEVLGSIDDVDHDSIFCNNKKVAYSSNDLILYENSENENMKIFHKNVKVFDYNKPSVYLYNDFLTGTILTEDRTLSSFYIWVINIKNLIVSGIKDKVILKKILLAPKDTFENNITFVSDITSYAYAIPSPEFLEVVVENKSNPLLNRSSYELYKQTIPLELREKPKNLTSYQNSCLDDSIKLLKSSGFDIDEFPIHIVEEIAPNVLGTAKNGKIYISSLAFTKGQDEIIKTLFEEWVHLKYGVLDFTRNMQNVLIDITISTIRENNHLKMKVT